MKFLKSMTILAYPSMNALIAVTRCQVSVMADRSPSADTPAWKSQLTVYNLLFTTKLGPSTIFRFLINLQVAYLLCSI